MLQFSKPIGKSTLHNTVFIQVKRPNGKVVLYTRYSGGSKKWFEFLISLYIQVKLVNGRSYFSILKQYFVL